MSKIDVGTGFGSETINSNKGGLNGRVALIKIHNNTYTNKNSDYFNSDQFIADNAENKRLIQEHVKLKVPNKNDLIPIDTIKFGLIDAIQFNTVDIETTSPKKVLSSDDFIIYTIYFAYDSNGDDNAEVIVDGNGPIFILNDATSPMTNQVKTSTSNNKVNLPLVIGVSVGGFVLLAIIFYYFMRKGRRSRGSKKVSNNRMSANRGGAKKAGRGRSK